LRKEGVNVDIKDSGIRRNFRTGAVRDMGKNKGRCDLMPLEQIGECLGDVVLTKVGSYVYNGQTESLEKAISYFIEKILQRDVYEVLLELSLHYEKGTNKYGERNWEKGIPLSSFIDSGTRHYLKYQAGIEDERHDLAFIWNILGAIWTHENKPEMINLPFKKES
jgi:hypothetical protein